eukprot:scaffold628_cov71-Phaeocystis_antarctica.AAC.2
MLGWRGADVRVRVRVVVTIGEVAAHEDEQEVRRHGVEAGKALAQGCDDGTLLLVQWLPLGAREHGGRLSCCAVRLFACLSSRAVLRLHTEPLQPNEHAMLHQKVQKVEEVGAHVGIGRACRGEVARAQPCHARLINR